MRSRRMRVDDVAPHGYAIDRANVRQRKTGRPVRFELTEQTRRSLDAYLRSSGRKPGQVLFPGRGGSDRSLTTRQYARLVEQWVASVGLDPRKFATHSMRRTKATLIYRRTGICERSSSYSATRGSKAPYATSASRISGPLHRLSSPHLRPIDVHSRAVNWYSFLQSRRTSPPQDAFRPEIGGRCRPTNICARSAGPSHSCDQWRNASCRPPARNAARVPPVSS